MAWDKELCIFTNYENSHKIIRHLLHLFVLGFVFKSVHGVLSKQQCQNRIILLSPISYSLECESQYNRTSNLLLFLTIRKITLLSLHPFMLPLPLSFTNDILQQLERTVCLLESRGQTRVLASIFLSFSLQLDR